MIETARLLLRPFQAEDLADYTAIRAKPEVVRYLPGGEARALEAAAVAHRVIALFTAAGEHPLPWAVVEKSSNRLIGHLGLRRLPELDGAVELLYLLDSAFWGQGYASEGARAALNYGFDDLRLKRIIGLVLPENRGSQAVLRKIGMVQAPDPVQAFGLTLTLFEMTPAMR
jgi:ribosomal-protein-alanine N-acetyltransferase